MTGPEDTLARVRAACDAARAVLDAPSGRTASAWWDKREDVEPEDLLAVEAVLHSLMRVYQEARGIFLEGCRCGLCEAVSDVDAALAGVPAPEDSPAEKEANDA